MNATNGYTSSTVVFTHAASTSGFATRRTCACTLLGSWHVARYALAAIIADKGLLALPVLSFACCTHEALLALTVSLTVCTFNLRKEQQGQGEFQIAECFSRLASTAMEDA